MTPVEKALWFIENNLHQPMTLQDIAAASDVSGFHLARAFVSVTGHAPISYLRLRRLSEAARQLQHSETDILSLALKSGYSSHEAFSRSFSRYFGISPKHARGAALPLLEPVINATHRRIKVSEPRLESTAGLLLAGLQTDFTAGNCHKIPQLWQRLGRHFHGQQPQSPFGYGVVRERDDSGDFSYLAAIEVTSFSQLPEGTVTLKLPPQDYLVFTHKGHFGALADLINTLWNDWLPESEYTPAEAPFFSKIDLFRQSASTSHKGSAEIFIPINS